MTSVLDHPGVVSRRNAASASWSVTIADTRYEIREWTWGERARLIESWTRHGFFDRSGFIEALVGLLVSPRPSSDLTGLVAAATLRLQGIDPEAPPQDPLLVSEKRLVTEWGWTFDQLDRQSACRIDQHLRATPPPVARATVAPAGDWNSIVVLDD